MTPMYIVFGAGAIGGNIGAAMIRGGEEVLFVDLVAEHVDAINARGLTIRAYDETYTVRARAVLPAQMPRDIKHVILAVKAQATAAALDVIAPALSSDGAVLSAQNGLNELVIAHRVGRARTLGCFVNFSATYLEPGVCVLGGPGAFWVGELDGADTLRIRAWQRALAHWGKPGVARRQVRITDNVFGFLWGKMGYGAMLTATALSNETMADGIDQFRPLMTGLVREIVQIARAEGVTPLGFDGYDPDTLTSGDPARARAALDALVEIRRQDTQTHSGIWRDLAVRKRKTEVPAQFGPILARADAHSIATPLTGAMVRMIGEIEAGARPLARENLEGLARLM